MTLEETLLSVPLDQWRVGQIYSYDWYDGPREGGCQLVTPVCEFYFELLDERFDPDGLDDRVYRLSELPAGAVAEMLALSRKSVTAESAARQEATRRLDALRAARRRTALVVYSKDMEHFLRCWQVDRAENNVKDWFALLKLPPVESNPAA